MLQAKTRRGRPKGTGIDDSDRISRLVELLKVRPDLKPTTAIRVMGFSDPSVIRRLRDKYKAFLDETEARPVAAKVSSSSVAGGRDPDRVAAATGSRS